MRFTVWKFHPEVLRSRAQNSAIFRTGQGNDLAGKVSAIQVIDQLALPVAFPFRLVQSHFLRLLLTLSFAIGIVCLLLINVLARNILFSGPDIAEKRGVRFQFLFLNEVVGVSLVPCYRGRIFRFLPFFLPSCVSVAIVQIPPRKWRELTDPGIIALWGWVGADELLE